MERVVLIVVVIGRSNSFGSGGEDGRDWDLATDAAGRLEGETARQTDWRFGSYGVLLGACTADEGISGDGRWFVVARRGHHDIGRTAVVTGRWATSTGNHRRDVIAGRRSLLRHALEHLILLLVKLDE